MRFFRLVYPIEFRVLVREPETQSNKLYPIDDFAGVFDCVLTEDSLTYHRSVNKQPPTIEDVTRRVADKYRRSPVLDDMTPYQQEIRALHEKEVKEAIDYNNQLLDKDVYFLEYTQGVVILSLIDRLKQIKSDGDILSHWNEIFRIVDLPVKLKLLDGNVYLRQTVNIDGHNEERTSTAWCDYDAIYKLIKLAKINVSLDPEDL